MRPLKLTMSAFGPYAEEETIDFTLLEDEKIFLITGPTGAGKTTIFDAMSYGIYGRASGNERESDNFRSDFAREDRLTFVELYFEIRGRSYYIKRTPQQKKKKLKGEGYTEQKSDAELKLPEGKVITGVTEVNKKIQELFGISYEQFRQIVMIPQGEFRELLSAGSRDREEIFRRVFGTQSFLRVQESLEVKAKALADAIKSFIEQRNTNIRNLNWEEREDFISLRNSDNLNLQELLSLSKVLMDEDKDKGRSLSKIIQALEEELLKYQQEITKAVQLNKELSDFKSLEMRRFELEGKKDYYYNHEFALEKGRKALTLRGKEEYEKNRRVNLSLKEKSLEESRKNLDSISMSLEESKLCLEREEGREEERKTLTSIVSDLTKNLEKVREFMEKRHTIEEVEKTLKLNEKRKSQKAAQVVEIKENLERLQEEIGILQSASISLKEKENDLKEKKEHKRKLDRLYSEEQRLSSIRDSYKICREDCLKEELVLKNAKGRYENLEDIYRKGQAGILGDMLQENIPCPVCGSLHHPSPARKMEGMPTEEELKDSKRVFEEKNKLYNELLNKLTELNTKGSEQGKTVNLLKEELSPFLTKDIDSVKKEELLSFVIREKLILEDELKSIDNEIFKLKEKENQLKNSLERQKHYKEELKVQEEEVKSLESTYLQSYGLYQRESEALKRLKEAMPSGIFSLEDLNREIEEKGNRLKDLEEKYKKAQENYNLLCNKKAAAEADNRNKEEDLRRGKEELKEAQRDLIEGVRQRGFKDIQDYERYKLSEDEIVRLDEEIKAYNEELKSITDRWAEREKVLQGLEPIDITIIENKVTSLKEEKQKLQEEERLLFSRITNNEKLLKEIIRLQNKIAEKEDSYLIFGELARVSKGNNPERISFERYVLAAYFDEIIEAANARFLKMTSGRYLLSRIKEKIKGNAQQGLELEVYDNYTGKCRHVKTLSGGESFKASLSMALGLADVVQANAGGISLETMFVDEGFGTLDPESLDNAISTLIELQSSGRLVGIISHVPELKERIQAKLVITTGVQGSHASFEL